MTISTITTKINNLIENAEFRAMVIRHAVTGVIPAKVWNSDSKLRVATYYTFAAEVIMRESWA